MYELYKGNFYLNYTNFTLQIHILQGLQPFENKNLHIK